MESLESKLDRLSPEQRKEVGDFVDFLLSRSGHGYPPQEIPAVPLPVLNVTPPPLTLTDPVNAVQSRPQEVVQDPVFSDDRVPQVMHDDGAAAPFHEIGGGMADRVTHDYMDYGQFESRSSPATEAVKKVKRKIIARDEQEKPRHLLDWVD